MCYSKGSEGRPIKMFLTDDWVVLPLFSVRTSHFPCRQGFGWGQNLIFCRHGCDPTICSWPQYHDGLSEKIITYNFDKCCLLRVFKASGKGSRPRPDEIQRSFWGRLKKSRMRLGLDPSNKVWPKQEFFSHSSEISELQGYCVTSVTYCYTVVEFDRKLLLKVYLFGRKVWYFHYVKILPYVTNKVWPL